MLVARVLTLISGLREVTCAPGELATDVRSALPPTYTQRFHIRDDRLGRIRCSEGGDGRGWGGVGASCLGYTQADETRERVCVRVCMFVVAVEQPRTMLPTRVAGPRCVARAAVDNSVGVGAAVRGRRASRHIDGFVHTAGARPVGTAVAAAARQHRAVRVRASASGPPPPPVKDSTDALDKLEMETEVNLLGTALAIGLLSGAAVVRPPPAPTHLTTASLLRTTRI